MAAESYFVKTKSKIARNAIEAIFCRPKYSQQLTFCMKKIKVVYWSFC